MNSLFPVSFFKNKYHMNYFEEADRWFMEITDHGSQGWGLLQSLSWLMVSTCCPNVATSTGSGVTVSSLVKKGGIIH